MANLSKITLPDGTVVDLKDAKKTGIYPVIGTQTAATGSWTGAIDVEALYAGLTIAYELPYAGSGNATLNLTLSGGGTTGAKNCYYNASRLTTHYPAGSTIIMTYWPAGSISVSGTATTDDRWVASGDYDTNSNTWRNMTVNSGAWKNTSTSSGAANFIDGTNITLTTNSSGLTIAANRYGDCSTAAATAAKEVTIAGTFTLTAGAMAVVKFANANSASNPTLNVNTTGAKDIYVCGAKIGTGDNKAYLKGLCFFVYDGTQYHLVNSEIKITTTGNGNAITDLSVSGGAITATKGSTFLTQHQVIAQDGIGGAIVNRFAICLTDAGTAAKTASITDGDLPTLFNGVRVTVYFENKNTASTPTLNVNNTGAVAIRHNGSTLSGDNVGLLKGAIDFVYTEDMAWNLVGNYIDTNTKNTAGSTNSTSKLFLVGATSQAANPQTYSNSAVYETNGVLNATSYDIAATAHISYDSTEKAILFTF